MNRHNVGDGQQRAANFGLLPVLPDARLRRLPPIVPSPGENKIQDEYNAIHVADTPCTDALKNVPGRWRTIRAHGKAVGLPSDDDMVGCGSDASFPLSLP